MKEEQRDYDGKKPNPQDWADLYESNPTFKDEFNRNFSDGTIPEVSDFTPNILDYMYLNMELAPPKDGESAQFTKVTKRLRDTNGLSIGVAHENPMLDTRIYEVKYHDVHKAYLTANTISENLFSQVDEEGNRHVLLDCIANHLTNWTELPIDEAYITSKNGGCSKRQTTNGWEILLQWKYGSTNWDPLKDIKECSPVQLAEYAIQNGISSLPVFNWWITFVI